jgi:hypothetical protein
MKASRFHDPGGLRLLQAYSDCTDDVTGDVGPAISCLNDGCVSCDVAAEIVQDGAVVLRASHFTQKLTSLSSLR